MTVSNIACIYFRYLGHLYMAEALVALDKIADGIQHLNPDLVTDINTLPPEQKSDQGKFILFTGIYSLPPEQKIRVNKWKRH